MGLLNGDPFVNLVSGGFGSRVTVETDPELKRRLGRHRLRTSQCERGLRTFLLGARRAFWFSTFSAA